MRIAIVICIAVLAGCSSAPQNDAREDAENSVVPNMLNQLTPEDRKEFAGDADGSLSDPIASVSIPISQAEKDLLAGTACADKGDDCDENKIFLKRIFEKYPDIKKVRFNPTQDIREDPESYEIYKRDFYSGLFFSKQIKLGDGETLFELITKCSKSVDPLTSAEWGRPGVTGFDWSMQFFPVFRAVEEDRKVELNMLYDRKGSNIVARSKLFSAHALTTPTFMADHGIRCWR